VLEEEEAAEGVAAIQNLKLIRLNYNNDDSNHGD